MHDDLRRSAAHALVADVDDPILDGPTEHHVRRVLRLRDGATVTVTDGGGRWRTCRLVAAGLDPDGDVVAEPAVSLPVTVGVAMPKGERSEWLVQKCTEVGVDRIVVLTAARSVVRWDGERAGHHLERLRRIATESSLQARRVWFPRIEGPRPAAEVLPGVVLAEPGGRPLGRCDDTVAVGPEGGWSPDELAVGGDRVGLGPYVLRVETAAVVAASQLVALRRGSPP